VIGRGANFACPLIIGLTGTSVTSRNVVASCIRIANCSTVRTFINVIANILPITSKSWFTLARDTGISGCTSSILVARAKFGQHSGTVVDRITRETISAVVLFARASVTTLSIGTKGIWGTLALTRFSALVNIIASGHTISRIAGFTGTSVAACSIGTKTGRRVTRLECITFVDISTGQSCSSVPTLTRTGVTPFGVSTHSITGTRRPRSLCRTLVNILARSHTITSVTRFTRALVRTRRVLAGGKGVTWVGRTLIDIIASLSVTSEAWFAGTRNTRVVWSTGCGRRTFAIRIVVSCTMIDGSASLSITTVIRFTFTSVGTCWSPWRNTKTIGIRIAFCSAISTLIDVRASETITRKSRITFTLYARKEGRALGIHVTLSIQSLVWRLALVDGFARTGSGTVVTGKTAASTVAGVMIKPILHTLLSVRARECGKWATIGWLRKRSD
jgi:hypothetical protein